MRLIILITYLLIFSYGFSQPLNNGHVPVPEIDDRAAGCAPANSSTYLEFNNVRALIHTGGNLWQISGQNFSQYEVPKGSGIMALFTSALWLGGIDINGQLKIAAVRYRRGQDYWTGPLTTTGDAEITPDVCDDYDQHFVISQDEVREFDAWFRAGLTDAENGTSTQEELFSGYEIPSSILDWPAHGNPDLNQDFYLAPFFDRDENGVYEPLMGDYPFYDLEKVIDCKTDRTVTLYGDQTIWWVMNDKGNIHTETGGDPLGMEIRCQAFAFATNDEINNMTFYNYELVNRSTQTLYDTYFGVFIDGALGGPNDDYVGCDVSRGLGYTYNGNEIDATDGGYLGYGKNPPAAGVDFFEGPYLDNDGIDNPIYIEDSVTMAEVYAGNGIPYSGLGIGYGDGIIDNERLGMRRFLYYNNLGGGGIAAQTDPITGQDYYNYLSGFWKDGTPFVYGGSGHLSSDDALPTVTADYMFPGDTDPLGWGTSGDPQDTWTEQTAGNVPFDRRFAQSAGPFILKAGAVNTITTGIVWARSDQGDPFQSVIALRKADDKAQALFDNCFKVLDGPHAPELTIQELENELIISIYNTPSSNNSTENYAELDPFIINADGVEGFDNFYRFQGYQVYQLINETVSPTELNNISKARLVYQCDIRDSIAKLVNYTFDEEIGAPMPQVMVNGANSGLKHSFSVTDDLFAVGDRKLVNFKKYHYMAISYASNEYKKFIPDDAVYLDGQKKPYISSRKGAIGEVIPYLGIPHSPNPEKGGTIQTVPYGYELPITRIDGWGNGGNWTEIKKESEDQIISNGAIDELSYVSGAGPIKIQVIDPLNLPAGEFELYFTAQDEDDLDTARWYLVNLYEMDTIFSDKTVDFATDQLIPEWGISVEIIQTAYRSKESGYYGYETDPIDARIAYSDSSKRWLSGNEDSDLFNATNWIRSGSYSPTEDECLGPFVFNPCYYRDKNTDFEQKFEGLLDGIVGPYNLIGNEYIGMPIGYPDVVYNEETGDPSSWFNPAVSQSKVSFADIHGVDIVITSDQSKWTQCPVIETGHNKDQSFEGASIMKLRASKSKDINGNEIETTGMSWFPGYAIDVETGTRLNMAFGENSWFYGSNGRDMLWNPTDEFSSALTGDPIFGGGHFIYVFGENIDDSGMPNYDNGQWLYEKLKSETFLSYLNAWKNCMWVVEPILQTGEDFLSADVRLSMRVSHPYQTEVYTGINNGLPAYRFSTEGIQSVYNDLRTSTSALDQIKIVPNPYYAYSEYESNGIDNRVKITNLPEVCNISIFNMNGGLVKQINKANSLTYEDWTLKNHQGVPIASGLYIFHIEVPGVGEKILKWYGAMRLVNTTNL
ncbi:T9SS C-terminal target domain-containing protein [Crocinitomix sp.]|nr:T9SS C-terminal target domain-containing protein [Crocinitomix sp.]